MAIRLGRGEGEGQFGFEGGAGGEERDHSTDVLKFHAKLLTNPLATRKMLAGHAPRAHAHIHLLEVVEEVMPFLILAREVVLCWRIGQQICLNTQTL